MFLIAEEGVHHPNRFFLTAVADREEAIQQGLLRLGRVHTYQKMSDGQHHRLQIKSGHLASLFGGIEEMAVLVHHRGSVLSKLLR